MCVILCSCSSLLSNVLEKPKIELSGIDVRDADFKGATLVFHMAVENPNSVDLKVDKVTYKVFINDKAITEASTDKAISVPAKGKGIVDLPMPLEYQKVFSNIQELLTANSAAYKIEGNAKLNLFSIPFTKEGSVKLR